MSVTKSSRTVRVIVWQALIRRDSNLLKMYVQPGILIGFLHDSIWNYWEGNLFFFLFFLKWTALVCFIRSTSVGLSGYERTKRLVHAYSRNPKLISPAWFFRWQKPGLRLCPFKLSTTSIKKQEIWIYTMWERQKSLTPVSFGTGCFGVWHVLFLAHHERNPPPEGFPGPSQPASW